MKTADFYSSATGTLLVNGGRDENAPAGVSLSIDDLSYIKQGSRANEESGSGFTPTEAQLAAMNSGITSSDVAQITTNKNNISSLINYFEFFPISDKTNTGAGNVVNQALKLKAGKYRFTATVSGGGSSQLKFTIGESGDTVDTKTWQNSTGTISEVYNLTSDTTWVTLYANAAVEYTNMSLKIEL